MLREYIWMDGTPVAVVENGVVYYVRADQIGRPVFATDSTGTKVWEATYLPFGEVLATTGTPINLRFPGQWFQSESGLRQNWMRDYDPTTGRYLQADPLDWLMGPASTAMLAKTPEGMWTRGGEEIRNYSTGRAFGVPLFNHAFTYGTECKCQVGTDGSLGSNVQDGGGNMLGRPYSVSRLPDGVSEREFIDNLSNAPSMNGGIYFPFLNDCHVQL